MTNLAFLQIIVYLAILLLLVKPLGGYMAQVYEGKPCILDRCFSPLERFIYRFCGIRPAQEMEWKKYLSALLFFNLIGFLTIYAIQRLQAYLPLNPQAFSAVTADLSFNTAASFITNTDWQAYSGEDSLSYFTQMVGLTVQNFISAATGMALLIALIRGLVRHETTTLGNFWVDTVRGTLYILLPLAFLWALALTSQGVIQNFKSPVKISLIQTLHYQTPKTDALGQRLKDIHGNPLMETLMVKEQSLPMGPVASQVAIKQLGTNGGGFFNANAAHPFENPTPLTNFLEMLAILLIPAALCYSFGVMVKDKRQGWALLIAMLLVFIPFMSIAVIAEQQGNLAFSTLDIEQKQQPNNYPAGNMEGKETRFGITSSALWAAATTATSNGSVNAMHDSFTPLGGLIPLWLMHLGEVIFGGVGCGLYSMLMLVIITVFVAGLMIGRTPEYLGKKIEPFEIKMASMAVLLMPLIVLLLSAIGSTMTVGTSAIANPGAHGFSEILYTFTSMGNNNGSAFAGLNANQFFYNTIGGLEMLLLRYWIAIPTIALAGSLVRKKTIPPSAGTLQTYTPLFVFLLIAVTLIIGALTFFPALALGPFAEQLTMERQYGH